MTHNATNFTRLHTHNNTACFRLHSPNYDNFNKVSVEVLHLGYEHSSYGLIEGSAVHVDGGSHWEHEPRDAGIEASLLLETLNGHWQSRRTACQAQSVLNNGEKNP